MLALSHLSRAHQAVVGIAARKAVGRGKDSPAFLHARRSVTANPLGAIAWGREAVRPVYVLRRPKWGVMLLSGKGAVATLRRR
jgi:hypothetical protein